MREETYEVLDSERLSVPVVKEEMEVNLTDSQDIDTTAMKKPRVRKKRFYTALMEQMEFYFGDANLARDRFLGKLVKESPDVPLDVFLTFNKIRALTDNVEKLVKALKHSSMLSVSEDGKTVRRVTPVKVKENSDLCTLYVENIPPDATDTWLKQVFSPYGNIDYISIPRFKSNRKVKGFAFIEFESPKGVANCIEVYEKTFRVLPSSTHPSELLSITTFNKGENKSETEEEEEDDDEGKPKKKDLEEFVKIHDEKSEPLQFSEISEKNDKNLGQETISAPEKKAKKRKLSEEEEKEETDEKDKEGKKNRKKKKKRKRYKYNMKEENLFVKEEMGLRVMPKPDWKRLRNKYLQLQRENMYQLKQHFLKCMRNQQAAQDKLRAEKEETLGAAPAEIGPARFSYVPGVIVKMVLNEPCTNVKVFTDQIRIRNGVKYVDATEGSKFAYVRCDSAENAQKLLQFVDFKFEDRSCVILKDVEEKLYWEKAYKDREEKLNKKIRCKTRGRAKLLKKAEKELGKHIKFEEV